jgi:hypothetical protein
LFHLYLSKQIDIEVITLTAIKYKTTTIPQNKAKTKKAQKAKNNDEKVNTPIKTINKSLIKLISL